MKECSVHFKDSSCGGGEGGGSLAHLHSLQQDTGFVLIIITPNAMPWVPEENLRRFSGHIAVASFPGLLAETIIKRCHLCVMETLIKHQH